MKHCRGGTRLAGCRAVLALALGLVLFGAARCMPQKNLVPIEVTDLTLDTTEENAGGVTETKSSEVIIGGSLKEAAHLHDSNELVVTLSVLVEKPRVSSHFKFVCLVSSSFALF